MNSFHLITGSGHCGSKWLATVIGAQNGVTSHHELRQQLRGGPWYEAIQHGPYHPLNGVYFDTVAAQLRQGDVWDSNSWGVHEIPQVNRLQQIAKAIYLVRHPIRQLHSLWTQSAAWGTLPTDHFLFRVWLHRAWQMDPQAPVYSARDRFGKMCELVRANVYGPQWLRRQGIPVRVCKLENLTQNPLHLHALWGIDILEARAWMQRDINRKVKSNRTIHHIWSLWTDDMRATFQEICADAMDAYEYPWPEQAREFA